MRRLWRFIRVAWRMSGNIPWIDEPEWERSDEAGLQSYLTTLSGKKLRMVLLNMVLRQNAHMVTQKNTLQFEAGYANGMRVTVHTLEALATRAEDPDEFAADIYGDEYLPRKVPTATDARLGTPFGRG